MVFDSYEGRKNAWIDFQPWRPVKADASQPLYRRPAPQKPFREGDSTRTNLSCMLTHTPQDDATVKCWGQNSDGQLGLGDTDNRGDGANGLSPAIPQLRLSCRP